jgi:hypothetical protein
MVRFFFVLPVDPYPDAFGEKKLIHRKDGSCVIGQAIEITYNGTVTRKFKVFIINQTLQFAFPGL